MEPLSILRADPLDLLFENRNKTYGAYPLRKYYNQRLLLSLGIVLSLSLTVSFLYLHFRGLVFQRKIPDVPGEVVLGTFDKNPLIKPPIPVSRPPLSKPPAVLGYTTPVIVRNEVPATSLASLDDLGTHAIGLETTTGEQGSDQLPGRGNAQGVAVNSTDSVESIPVIFDHTEQMPEFPGGVEALKRFLQKNLRMPENNLESGEQIKVIARFVVGPDGRVRDIEIIQAADEVFNKEVRRVILKMPDWKPGMQHKRNVAVYFNLPVNFVAEE